MYQVACRPNVDVIIPLAIFVKEETTQWRSEAGATTLEGLEKIVDSHKVRESNDSDVLNSKMIFYGPQLQFVLKIIFNCFKLQVPIITDGVLVCDTMKDLQSRLGGGLGAALADHAISFAKK